MQSKFIYAVAFRKRHGDKAVDGQMDAGSVPYMLNLFKKNRHEMCARERMRTYWSTFHWFRE